MEIKLSKVNSIMSNPAKPTLWAEDKPTVTTVIPELAEEIGLNESLVLRQIVFWINISNNLRDGEWWTYQSLNDMKEKAFPYFSIATLSRTVNKLIDKGLLKKTDQYNKRKSDRTQWFALDIEGASQLKSVKVVLQGAKSTPKEQPEDETILHIETPILQNETRVLQNETTLPDYKPEYKEQKEKTSPDPEPKPLNADAFQEKMSVLRDAGLLINPTDFQSFKDDADDFTLAQWEKGRDMVIERRKVDGKHKNYKYLMRIMADVKADELQGAITEANKPVVPYHKPFVPEPDVIVSDEERLAMLKQLREAREKLGESA